MADSCLGLNVSKQLVNTMLVYGYAVKYDIWDTKSNWVITITVYDLNRSFAPGHSGSVTIILSWVGSVSGVANIKALFIKLSC